MSGARYAAFVVSHPYVDALACFREPIRALADAGWHVDLYTTISSLHGAPVFAHDRIRVVPIEMTPAGTLQMISRLVTHRPRYRWLFAPPQWSLYYGGIAARLAGIGLVCISDELTSEAEARTPLEKQWKARERRAHQRCAFTIALSDERGAYIREENHLGPDHLIFTVPNSAPGPAVRLRSHYYQDILDLDADRFVVLHSGSWWWRLQFASISDVVKDWDEDTVLVFQGRLMNHLGDDAPHAKMRVSPAVLPSALLDYATSSAHVGLALYAATTANHAQVGTASGKIALYMKNVLPVITTRQPSLEWVEQDGCGVCIDDLREIAGAVRRIRSRYDEYCANVRRVYDERWNFTRAFAPVLARVERGR